MGIKDAISNAIGDVAGKAAKYVQDYAGSYVPEVAPTIKEEAESLAAGNGINTDKVNAVSEAAHENALDAAQTGYYTTMSAQESSPTYSNGVVIGDNGQLIDYSVTPQQLHQSNSNILSALLEQRDGADYENENSIVNDIGQIQDLAGNQNYYGRIHEFDRFDNRAKQNFDWDAYMGGQAPRQQDLYTKNPSESTPQTWVGENGQLMGEANPLELGDPEGFTRSGMSVIDNGTNTYENRTSPFITYEEAVKQAEAQNNKEMLDYLVNDVTEQDGAGKILSKTDLEDAFGYERYLPDAWANAQAIAGDLGTDVNNLWKGLGEARQNAALDKGMVNVNGKNVSIRDADNDIANYFKGLQDGNIAPDFKLPESDTVFTWEDLSEGEFVLRDDGLYFTDADGNEFFITTDFDKSSDPTDYFEISLPDCMIGGEYVKAKDIPKYTSNPILLQALLQDTESDMSYDDFVDFQQNAGNKIDYGFGDFYRPDYATRGFINGQGLTNPLGWLPDVTDIALQSAPWMLPGINTVHQYPGMGMMAMGVDPDSAIRSWTTDGPKISMYDPSFNPTLGSLAYGLAGEAEKRIGDIGSVRGGKGVIDKMLEKIPGMSTTAAGRYFAQPAISEGIEEIVTDPLWELAQQGGNAFADTAVNEAGYDTGEYIPTSMSKRISNALDPTRIAENFIGGATLGGVMGGAGGVIKNIKKDEKGQREWQREKAQLKSGLDEYDDDYDEKLGKYWDEQRGVWMDNSQNPDINKILEHEKLRLNNGN